jgi:hypothetical protein
MIIAVVAVIVAGLALVVLSVGTDRGTVRGQLVVEGGPAPRVSRLLPGVVTFRSRNGDIQTVTTRDGNFTIDLPVGHYEVGGRSPLFENDAQICGRGTKVTVQVDRTATVSVRCRGA